MFETLTLLGIACVGGIVWFVRLEGRVNGHDTLFVEREKQQESQYENIIARLNRIESKLDNPTSPEDWVHRMGR